jgi:hypothetical protein
MLDAIQSHREVLGVPAGASRRAAIHIDNTGFLGTICYLPLPSTSWQGGQARCVHCTARSAFPYAS